MSSAGHAPASASRSVEPGEHASPIPAYTEFHPRWYRRQVSTYWWLGQWPYVKFILRELSSVAVAWTVAITLLQLWAIGSGPEAYAVFAQRMSNPIIVALNLIAFAFLLLHSITWFNLAPKAMAIRIHGKRLPALMISGPQFLAWAVISAVVLGVVLTLK
jgi:fumarate reductase subunit C